MKQNPTVPTVGVRQVSPFHLQYASDDELPSESEVELVIGQLKQQELERVGFQQLTLF